METSRLGIYAGFGFTVPFEERLALIREAGFGATALWWEEKNPTIRQLRHRAPEMVRRAGLHLDNIHVPYFACRELWSDDPVARAESVALHTSWIDDCRRHAIPHMVMHVSLGASTPPEGESGLDSFRRLVERAADAEVTIAIENTRDDSYLDYLFERIDHPALSLCFDTSHDHLHGSRPDHLLDRWSARLSTLHLSDTDGRRDHHWLPGEGAIDFSAYPSLWNESYAGAYVLECVPRDRSEPPASFLMRARQRLESCLEHAVLPRA